MVHNPDRVLDFGEKDEGGQGHDNPRPGSQDIVGDIKPEHREEGMFFIFAGGEPLYGDAITLHTSGPPLNQHEREEKDPGRRPKGLRRVGGEESALRQILHAFPKAGQAAHGSNGEDREQYRPSQGPGKLDEIGCHHSPKTRKGCIGECQSGTKNNGRGL